jgi:hypothetical protein
LHKTAVGVSGVKSAARELTCAPQNGEDQRERERGRGREAKGKVERGGAWVEERGMRF